MPIRKPKPTSPGRRFVTYADFGELTKKAPEKSLTEGLKKSGGRNWNGRKTARRRDGGAQEPVPPGRLHAAPRRRAGARGRDRVRPEPVVLYRAAALRGRPKTYILAPNGLKTGMNRGVRPEAELPHRQRACRS